MKRKKNFKIFLIFNFLIFFTFELNDEDKFGFVVDNVEKIEFKIEDWDNWVGVDDNIDDDKDDDDDNIDDDDAGDIFAVVDDDDGDDDDDGVIFSDNDDDDDGIDDDIDDIVAIEDNVDINDVVWTTPLHWLLLSQSHGAAHIEKQFPSVSVLLYSSLEIKQI